MQLIPYFDSSSSITGRYSEVIGALIMERQLFRGRLLAVGMEGVDGLATMYFIVDNKVSNLHRPDRQTDSGGSHTGLSACTYKGFRLHKGHCLNASVGVCNKRCSEASNVKLFCKFPYKFYIVCTETLFWSIIKRELTFWLEINAISLRYVAVVCTAF